MKKMKKIIKNLEKRGIFSKKPKPIYPFLLTIMSFTIWYLVPISNQLLKTFTFSLATFTFIFAILHWIVVLILES